MGEPSSLHFIDEIVAADVESKRWNGRVHTRFPPEPNGFLHIGHAKSIVLNFGLAQRYGGKFNLRFDDTNPEKESQHFVDAIIEDVRWLGGNFEDRLFYASDYFEKMYALARQLIGAGMAYVCDLDAVGLREYRGTLTTPGQESPGRRRGAQENLELFRGMRDGAFPQGSRTLRAKIDMASSNLNLRDPVMYRIIDRPHHRQGAQWKIYPSYDWAHGLEDSIEEITHSICTLEFENHRPLYDWFLGALGVHHPQQIEFAKLQLSYTVLSKRNLLQLVEMGQVGGWDDPRMPTIAGMRRRGFPAAAIRTFCEAIGVTKIDSVIDIGRLENAVRDALNAQCQRRMAVLDPLRVVLTNYPRGETEQLEIANHPDNPSAGTRMVPFGREIFIERDDFMEVPPEGYFRLQPGKEVRLRGAYVVRCEEVVKGTDGTIREIRCSYDPATRGGNVPDGRKVRGTIHWVHSDLAISAEVHLIDRLFVTPHPGSGRAEERSFLLDLNPTSLKIVADARLEPALKSAKPGESFQFERIGYFTVDADAGAGIPRMLRTIGLKDAWSKTPQRVASSSKARSSAQARAGTSAPHDESAVSAEAFERVLLCAGRILGAKPVAGSEKLLELQVDLGELGSRTIVSGVALAFAPQALVGRMATFVANLAPRSIMGISSNGMLLTAGNSPKLALLDPGEVSPGTRIR